MTGRPALSLPDFPPEATAEQTRARIREQARHHLFNYGYGALTMDALAAELGMSKKTLYVHFRSKHALARAIIDQFSAEAKADANALLSNKRLTFAEKLRGFTQGMMDRFASLSPAMLHDLQRYAPDLHRHIEHIRSKNIPYVFGRFIEEGQLAGAVRDDISPVFASEFYLHALQGLMHPDSLRRRRSTLSETFEQAIGVFFGGLLTPAGQKEYEKLFPR